MSARARFRSRNAWTHQDKRRAGIVAGIVLGSFLLGYGITALSFNQATGTDVITVPDVRQMTLEDARRALARDELEVALGDSFPNVETPAGSVLAQSPLPGQEVSPGSEVQIFVSTGPPRPTVPVVDGMPVTLATSALQTAGFEVMVQDTPAAAARGRVVGTDPPAGSALQLPAAVRLWVSSGPPWIEMPSVVGMVEADARAALEAAGLTVGPVEYEATDFGQPGGVVAQEPEPGDSVNLGTEIRLRVVAPAAPITFGDDRRDRDDRDDRDDRRRRRRER